MAYASHFPPLPPMIRTVPPPGRTCGNLRKTFASRQKQPRKRLAHLRQPLKHLQKAFPQPRQPQKELRKTFPQLRQRQKELRKAIPQPRQL
jgi:hypothetical protein